LRWGALSAFAIQAAKGRFRQITSQPDKHMASSKKKASAKSSIKFKDLKSKKNPKGGLKHKTE